MIRRPPRSTRTDTLLPYTTLFRSGLPVVVVNPTLPVGPGDHLLTPPSRMLIEFLSGRTPAYLETAINMIDVRDAALGHLLAAERGRIGPRYILGGENLSMSALLALLEELRSEERSVGRECVLTCRFRWGPDH